LQPYCECEAALRPAQEHDVRVDPHIADLVVAAPADDAERTFEARGVTDCEELLGVGSAAIAA
jgi:hypothetical protein